MHMSNQTAAHVHVQVTALVSVLPSDLSTASENVTFLPVLPVQPYHGNASECSVVLSEMLVYDWLNTTSCLPVKLTVARDVHEWLESIFVYRVCLWSL